MKNLCIVFLLILTLAMLGGCKTDTIGHVKPQTGSKLDIVLAQTGELDANLACLPNLTQTGHTLDMVCQTVHKLDTNYTVCVEPYTKLIQT